MTRRRSPYALAIALLALATTVTMVAMPTSGATFTSRSNATAGVNAAPDWTPPTVTMRDPGAVAQGVVTVTADSADAETGIRDVVIQRAVDGGDWVTVCTDTTAPYSCSWDTRTVPDGDYTLRAVATDNAGYSTTSEHVTTMVANNLRVVLSNPGDLLRGTVQLTETLYASVGTASYQLRIQRSPAGMNSWTDIGGTCTRAAALYTAPLTCAFDTTKVNSGSYDLRAYAVTGGVTTYSNIVADVLIDNTEPNVALQNPPEPLRGMVEFQTVSTDDHSGVDRVTVQVMANGTSTWVDYCTATVEPWSCEGDTTPLADFKDHTFRAVATDLAGNTKISGTTNRKVDNTVPSVSVGNPGAIVFGTVPLNAFGHSYAGVTSVRIQYSPNGTGTWTDVCTATTKPYTCPWDTTKVTDGLYDLRAVMVDGAGKTFTSNVVAARLVDNNPVRGVDVQTFSGGPTRNKADNGDRVTFLYSKEMNLSTISAGWAGAPLAVTVRIRDGGVLLPKLDGRGDTLDVLVGPVGSRTPVNIGSVRLNEDYIKGGKTAEFAGTLTRSVTTYQGYPATLLTLQVGALTAGDGIRQETGKKAMQWTPSPLATDLFGQKVSTTPALESGILDAEF